MDRLASAAADAPAREAARRLDMPCRRTYDEHRSQLSVEQKLAILADAAKYASCASSGAGARDSRGIGSTAPGMSLREGPGAAKADAPAGDPVEAVWKTCYAAICNPARVNRRRC